MQRERKRIRWPAGVFLNLASQHLNTVIIGLRYNKITPWPGPWTSQLVTLVPGDILTPPYAFPSYAHPPPPLFRFVLPPSLSLSRSPRRITSPWTPKARKKTKKQEIIGGLKMIFCTVDALPPIHMYFVPLVINPISQRITVIRP